MKNASTNRSRVPVDALDPNLHRHTKESQCPIDNITKEIVSRNISWIGPRQMATWRITGYVADSEDEDQEIDFTFLHHNESQLNRRNTTHDGVGTTSDGTSALDENGSLLENFQAQIKRSDESNLTILIQGAHKEHVDEDGDTRELGKELSLDSRLDQEFKAGKSCDQSTDSPISLGQSSDTAVHGLEASIGYGQSITESVLRPQYFPTIQLDDLDSPLSTPPDSPIPPSDHALPHTEDRAASPMLVSSVNPSSRSFRPRKAIQINPYLLDYAKHQKEWGERGLKPVHNLRASSPEHRTHEAESQESASRDDSQSSEHPAQESMDIDEVNRMPDLASFDEDLPDLDALLYRDVFNTRQRPKRKPTLRQFNEGILKLPDIFDLPLEDETSPVSTKIVRQPIGLKQNSFPSPPRSTNSSLADHSLSTISEVRISPELPTPTASAGFRARRRPIIEDDSQSQSEVQKTIHAISSSESDNSSSDAEVESENVRIMQKKLRGVLPASVMTIAKAQQDINKKRRDAAQAASKSTLGPGVAERQSNKTTRRQSLEKSTSNWYEDLVSEDDDSEEDARSEVLVAIDRNRDSEANDRSMDSDTQLHEDPEAVEAMDDDGFDRMVPARPRAKNVRHKKQANMRSVSLPELQQRKRRHREHGVGDMSRPRKRTKRPSSGDIVHVHDAPDLSAEITIRPSWLRVAARQARRTKTPGTMVSRKFFELDSLEETAAVLDGVSQRIRGLANKTIKASGKVSRKSALGKADRSVSNPSQAPHNSVGSRQRHRRPSLRLSTMDDASIEPNLEEITKPTQHDEDTLLRLTRLRSLLPMKNRAGRGRLAHKPSEPRVAQMEEVQQSYSRLSRHTLRRPSTIEQPQHPTDYSTRPTSTHEGEVEPEGQVRQSPHPTLQEGSARGLRRKKKQTPTYRPILHQTLLVPLTQDTARLRALVGQTDSSIKTVLEREFAAHQISWFQGRKDGITCTNNDTQRHFRVFLEVLGSYLSAISENSNGAQNARELRSFLYRLVPNRGLIGAQGQVGDKRKDVLEFDILVAKNVFDLHVCLLNLAPAYAPLPRVLETKVSFTDAHNEICLTALSAWQAICDHHHAQHFIADGLSNWLYLILTQLISRWKLAESEARAEAEQSVRRVGEQVVRKVIEHNRTQASDLITATLNCLIRGIEYATGVGEAGALLNLDRYIEVAAALVRLPDMQSEVFTIMLEVASSYTKQWLSQSPLAISPLLSCLRQIITALTSFESILSHELKFSTIRAFFYTAQTAVKYRQKSWDDFIVPTSSFSLHMFVSTKHQDASKALFYHLLLENDQNAYLIDFRVTILSQWLRILLLAQDDEPSAMLTSSVFNREKDSLEIPSLAASFHPPGLTFSSSAIRGILPEIRHATTMHIIANLSGQENNAEAEWLPGGLDEPDAVYLLKTIFTTMKETWMSLREKPEEQDTYTVLIHEALNQYEIHSRSDFTIEPWFSNSAVFPQRRKHSLAQLFTKHILSDTEFVRSAKDVMQQEISHARRFNKMDNLAEELKELLLPTTIEPVSTPQITTQILSRHMLFIRHVLPPLIKPTGLTPNDARSMLLDILLYITSTIEHRTSTHSSSVIKDFTSALLAIIAALSDQFLVLDVDDRAKVYTLTHLTFELSVTTGDALPDEFMDNVGRICDFAVQDESREGMALLAVIVERI